MYRIGQLVETFGISRSTLLYYDKIQLLSPSHRTQSNYRTYSQADYDRLEQIMIYKEAGLSLEEISELLDSNINDTSKVLEQRLLSLNSEIALLREQQKTLVSLLGKESLLRETKVMSKEQWVNILKSCGMDEEDMRQWHIEFERHLPEVHTDFLASLGIDQDEIDQIKCWSQEGIKHSMG